jgi:hypothetical protein
MEDEVNDRQTALTLAVQTAGNPNTLTLAQQYLDFLRADEAAAKKTPETTKQTEKSNVRR